MIVEVKQSGACFSWHLFDELGLTTLSGKMYPDISQIIEHISKIYPEEKLELRITSKHIN